MPGLGEMGYLIDCQGEMVVSKSLLHQGYESMSLDEFGVRQRLGVDLPVALQFDCSLGVA